jgi:DNA-binding MarR family transcriptional regulator
MLQAPTIVLVLDQLNLLAAELVSVTNVAIAAAGEGDLSFAQWRLLAVLGSETRPLRLHEVATQISVSMPSASRLVARMERRGLLSSSRDPVDRRGRLIALTDEGRSIRDQVIGRRRAMLADKLATMSMSAAVVDVLTEIVDKLAGWL